MTVDQISVFVENKAGERAGAVMLGWRGTMKVTNSVFTKNTAKSQGGAFWMQEGENETYASFENSSFTENTANFGAGIYLSGEETLILKGCVLERNAAGSMGGAIYGAKGAIKLALIDVDIQNNTAKYQGGGIKTDGTIISMQGLVRIINNQSLESAPYHNLYFGLGGLIANPGLYEGSQVRISSKGIFAAEITKYQLRYFTADSGKITFSEQKAINTPIYATLFGNGSWIVIALLAAVGAAVTAVLVVKKKKASTDRKEVEDEDEDEE